MKKINYLIACLTLLIFINGCSGYKPIFSSSDVNFEISEFLIEGDKVLGKQILSKLQRLSKTSKKNQNRKNIDLYIKVEKDKNVTAKDSAGKINEYKITLRTIIKANDYLTNRKILNAIYTSSISYKKQNNYSDTVNAEKKAINNLIDKTYQELLIQLTQNTITK